MPRSGHHLLVNLIQDVANRLGLPFSYCEYYNHFNERTRHANVSKQTCAQDPCDMNCMLMKTHDFELDATTVIPIWKTNIKITAERPYIVLYRDDPLVQMEAWYRHFMSNSKAASDTPYDPETDDYSKFPEFYKKHRPYYDKFVQKWIKLPYKNMIISTYNELVSNTVRVLLRALCVVYSPHISLFTHDLLQDVVNAHDVSFKYTLSPEKYERLLKSI